MDDSLLVTIINYSIIAACKAFNLVKCMLELQYSGFSPFLTSPVLLNEGVRQSLKPKTKKNLKNF